MSWKTLRRLSGVLISLFVLLGGSISGAFAILPLTQPPDNSSLKTVEVWRVRIDNSECGRIEISLDRGQNWALIGRVNAPATASLKGYLAAGYAPVGAVAAEAVHGIRIRLGTQDNAYPNLINIVPREFASTPVFFGGHIAGASGIYTDIPSGFGLFREFSPYVGSQCFLSDPASGALQPLDSKYTPEIGDILTIIVKRRVNEIRSIVFPNQAGQPVTVTYADGTSQVVTHVAKAVTGIGRFDGTSYTGVGAVNTNHTCVITISTAPVTKSALLEGVGDERRGGFQIEPFYHNTQTDEVGAPQVLVIGHPHIVVPELEGREPLYFGGINLAWDPSDLPHSWICDVQTAATGDTWLTMPTMVGSDGEAIEHRGITAFRLHRDLGDEPDWLLTRLAKTAKTYQDIRLKQAQNGDIPFINGNYLAHPGVSLSDLKVGIGSVEFTLEGKYIGITNYSPYVVPWDSHAVPNGEYALRSTVLDKDGKLIDSFVRCVYIENQTQGTVTTK